MRFIHLHSNLLKPSPDFPRRNFFSKIEGFRSDEDDDAACCDSDGGGGVDVNGEDVAAADTVATGSSLACNICNIKAQY